VAWIAHFSSWRDLLGGTTVMEPRLRVTFIYEGPLACDHGSKRILEQMGWLVAAGCDVSLAPVWRPGDEKVELSDAVDRLGISLLDPVRGRRRLRLTRAYPNVRDNCTNVPHLAQVALASDWVVVGNTSLAGSIAVAATARSNKAVVSWDGDSLSRWYGTYSRWLRSSNEYGRALRRRVGAISAAKFERRLTNQYHFLTVPGPADIEAIQLSARRRSLVLLIPNVVRTARLQDDQRLAPQSTDALFVGSSYGPNIDGLRWLLETVWPEVRRRRPAQLTIAGRGLDCAEILLGGSPPKGVNFLGRVAELGGLYRSAKVVVIPVFYGGGVPNKVLEALACDSPLILTSYAAEALGEPQGIVGIDGASAWIEAIVAGFDDPSRNYVDRAVRKEILTVHGEEGFDRAMARAVDLVRALRSR